MARLLVTGGAGFLGSHLVDALVGRGHAVTVLDRQRSRWLPDGARMLEADLGDRAALAAAVEGNDAVYHLAGFADLNAAKTQPLDTVHANIVGTVHLLEAMRAHGVSRFLFASTAYVYSREGGFYRCSKQACESYIEEYGRTFGLRYTIIRYGSLYGPRADASNGVYRLLRTAMTEGRLVYSGAPDDIREYIHVDDAATLSADVLDAAYEGQHVTLTGASPTRASELFMMFQEILGQRIEIDYRRLEGPGSGHYAVTPYAYTPRPGKKLVTTHYVDMGQGLLRMIEDIHREIDRD
ncbi:MAG: NAD(P)-dependent oxidoreductase [Deltaproteobacteria bacterium]|nr:MAG: NAD(P)-dependent oxidoreductase [Deltaproteobacteria bacterium]TMQ26961.1 MAG: NAD(P)-dependent oxidoreductase [Deltaproteobacteria bacterium]